MANEGRKAWLVTWEGRRWSPSKRPKIVAVLPPRLSQSDVKDILHVLFCSEYYFTGCEKIGYGLLRRKDRRQYLVTSPDSGDVLYGFPPDEYLFARLVKNLRCEEDEENARTCVLNWTELPRFRWDELYNRTQVRGERKMQYSTNDTDSIEQ